MSVRATGRLIGELVKVSSLLNSPQMVVSAINEETKIITALDRAEANRPPQKRTPSKPKRKK
jgi:hypothetical protein